MIAYPRPGTIVAGDGVAMSYSAATPGAWWRGVAGQTARRIVEAVGGLAEDDQGKITLVVERAHAWRAHQIMSGVAIALGHPVNEENLYVLLAAGCATLGRALEIAPVFVNASIPTDGRQISVCPVALTAMRDGWPDAPRAVRFGIVDSNGSTWSEVWADVHEHGRMITVWAWSDVALSHVDRVEVDSYRHVTWPADVAVDDLGNAIPVPVAVSAS